MVKFRTWSLNGDPPQWAKIANFGEAEVGTTVLLAIPDVDKGRCELPNLKCVVLEKTGGGMYR